MGDNTQLKPQVEMQTAAPTNFDFDGAQLVISPLVNSSFETNTTSPWSNDPGTTLSVLASPNPEEGKYFLEANTQTGAYAQNSFSQTVSQTVSTSQSYTFSIWVRTSNGQPGTVYVDLWATGGSGYDGGRTIATVSGTWTQISYTLNPIQSNNTQLKAQVEMLTAAPTNFDFDGASLH
jgi:hypothetical protein